MQKITTREYILIIQYLKDYQQTIIIKADKLKSSTSLKLRQEHTLLSQIEVCVQLECTKQQMISQREIQSFLIKQNIDGNIKTNWKYFLVACAFEMKDPILQLLNRNYNIQVNQFTLRTIFFKSNKFLKTIKKYNSSQNFIDWFIQKRMKDFEIQHENLKISFGAHHIQISRIIELFLNDWLGYKIRSNTLTKNNFENVLQYYQQVNYYKNHEFYQEIKTKIPWNLLPINILEIYMAQYSDLFTTLQWNNILKRKQKALIEQNDKKMNDQIDPLKEKVKKMEQQFNKLLIEQSILKLNKIKQKNQYLQQLVQNQKKLQKEAQNLQKKKKSEIKVKNNTKLKQEFHNDYVQSKITQHKENVNVSKINVHLRDNCKSQQLCQLQCFDVHCLQCLYSKYVQKSNDYEMTGINIEFAKKYKLDCHFCKKLLTQNDIQKVNKLLKQAGSIL